MTKSRPAPVAALTELADRSREDLSPIELSNEWRARLLDPEAWGPVLETYARTMRLGVALTDRSGRLLGECHNAQPTWRLARETSPAVEGACPFCLAPAAPCTAVADALRTGRAVLVRDGVGLAHAAVPLSLLCQPLGALVAGQVFNRYPEPLTLQRAARDLGVSQQRLWHEAIQERPVSRVALQTYAELLTTLGSAFVGDRYASILHGALFLANQSIARSLVEKEVMLKEIHHRVKNNLAIISSLFGLQAKRLDPVLDARAIVVLAESRQRIQAMADTHDLLYSTDRIGEINLAEYLKNLVERMIISFQPDAVRISARFDLAPVPVSLVQAIPCGLIANELVTNVCKYAYPGGGSGEIRVVVKLTDDDRVSLTIGDSGGGIPEGVDWQNTDSLGMRIIRILTGQLGGTLELDNQGGASFTLQFPRERAGGGNL